jgi:hypothetical protein
MVDCMGKKEIESFSDEETQRRFEAALRGAREVGHESMKDISPKRRKLRAAMKVGKRDRKELAEPPKSPSR